MPESTQGRRRSASIALAIALGAATAARASPDIAATFGFQGPAAIDEYPAGTPDFYTSGNGPFAGAVRAVVAHPTNPDLAWVGSVNGGVYPLSSGDIAVRRQ